MIGGCWHTTGHGQVAYNSAACCVPTWVGGVRVFVLLHIFLTSPAPSTINSCPKSRASQSQHTLTCLAAAAACAATWACPPSQQT